MKFGAIDIGTNSTRLMIAQLKAGERVKAVRREAIITRIGEGVNETSHLKQEAVDRTIQALNGYKSILQQEGVEKVVIAATSAVRDAKNSDVFLEQVEHLFGTPLKVLSGEKEAQLAFLGATYDLELLDLEPRISNREQLDSSPLPPPSSLVLVLDIGGGSTELIIGCPPDILDQVSMNIGSVRLTEMFLKSDPPTKTEIKQTTEQIHQVLDPVVKKIASSPWWPGSSEVVLIGVAGTITTISAVKQQMETYDAERIHHSRLNHEDISRILAVLLSKPLDQRKKIPGLQPKRADVIIAGTLIALSVLEAFGLGEIIVSECDILDGLILSFSHFKATL